VGPDEKTIKKYIKYPEKEDLGQEKLPYTSSMSDNLTYFP